MNIIKAVKLAIDVNRVADRAKAIQEEWSKVRKKCADDNTVWRINSAVSDLRSNFDSLVELAKLAEEAETKEEKKIRWEHCKKLLAHMSDLVDTLEKDIANCMKTGE